MSQQNPSPATVAISTSTATNAHLRSKAPKWLKEAAHAARTGERGSTTSMVMDLSVANARKAETWLTAEADRLVAGERRPRSGGWRGGCAPSRGGC